MTPFPRSAGRFLPAVLCLIVSSVLPGVAAEALRPIAGTVDMLQNGGKTLTRSVSSGGSIYTLVFERSLFFK